jgi:hypothetical protein
MKFPTWSRVAYLLQRYSHGVPMADALYVPEALCASPPCGKQRPLCSLTETGSRGAGLPGVKNKWIYVR